MKRICFTAYFFLAAFRLIAGDSIPARQRVWENSAVLNNFFEYAYLNPAVKHFQYDYTLTNVDAGALFRKEEEPSTMEEGDGLKMFLVDVDSYIRLKKAGMWGKASYRNGKKTNLNWNETTDHPLLYPYIMGDTVGGDLKSEEYFFLGGYSSKAGRLAWGVNAGYRATIEYRNVDPRPKNLVSDLDFRAGLSYQTVKNYYTGISVRARKYKQTNELAFYNEQGVPNVYHFTGLGFDYVRFRGSNYATYYKGKTFGGGLNLFSPDKTGFVFSLLYDYFSFEKIISSLNELPMAGVGEHSLTGEIGYKRQSALKSWGVKLEGAFIGRSGTENIFGDASNNIYPLIASAKQYKSTLKEASVSAFYTQQGRRGYEWAFLPEILYRGSEAQYIYPSRRMNLNRIVSSLDLQLKKKFGGHLLQVSAGVGHSFAFHHDLYVSEEGTDNVSTYALYHNYGYLSSDNIRTNINARFDYVLNGNYTLFLSAGWQHCRWYEKEMNADDVRASIGVAF